MTHDRRHLLTADFAATLRTFFAAASLLAIGPVFAQVPTTPPERAESSPQRLPVPMNAMPTIDAGNGLALQLFRRTKGRLGELDIASSSPSLKPPLQTDLPRVRRAGVSALTLLIHPDSGPGPRSNLTLALDQLDIAQRLVERHEGDFAFARTADEVLDAFRSGKVALLASLTDGDALEGSLGALRAFEQLGVVSVALNGLGTFERPDGGGLTPLGQTALIEANRLGVAVDLSGTLPQTTSDILGGSLAPVIATGVGCHQLANLSTNLSDDALVALGRNGGVILIPLSPLVLSNAVREHVEAEWEVFRDLWTRHAGDSSKVKRGLDAWRKSHRRPTATVDDVVAHILHARDKAGIESVAIATGFDAMPEGPIHSFGAEPAGLASDGFLLPSIPEGPVDVSSREWRRGVTGRERVEGIADIASLDVLWSALAKRGLSARELELIKGENYLRVLRSVRSVSTRLKQHRSPAEGEPSYPGQ